MSLRYPNARLFIQDMLFRKRLSGAQALAAAACCFDVVPKQAVSEILSAPLHRDCRCMDTGAEIVRQHFEHRAKQDNGLQVDHKVVWRAIETQILKRPEAATISIERTASNESASTCHHHAPALFDIMLQQLMRY